MSNNSWMYPKLRPKVTSSYGWRTLNGTRQWHNGLDFISEDGSNIVVDVADGVVVHDQDSYDPTLRWDVAKPDSGGRFAVIAHTWRGVQYYVSYLHLEENFVSKGERVHAGQHIGKEGDYGYSFGRHLHITVWNSNWVAVDPMLIFQ